MKFGLKIGLFAVQNFFSSWLPWGLGPQVKIVAEHQLKLFPTSWPAAVSPCLPYSFIPMSKMSLTSTPWSSSLAQALLGWGSVCSGLKQKQKQRQIVDTVSPSHRPLKAFGNTLCLPQEDSTFGFVCLSVFVFEIESLSVLLAGATHSIAQAALVLTTILLPQSLKPFIAI